MPAAPERHTLALRTRPTFYCELFRAYRSPRFPSAHPRSGPLGAPFGRLACGAKATHARALRSPYFLLRIISLTARGSAPAKICILQYPYRNPTVGDPGPHYALASSRSKDLGAGAPRTPRHTVGYCTPAHARGKRAAQSQAKPAHSERKMKITVILQYPPHYSTPTVTPSPYYSTPPTIAGGPHTLTVEQRKKKKNRPARRAGKEMRLPPSLPPPNI